MKEAAIHGAIAKHAHVSRIGIGQDGLRTMLLCDRAQTFRDQVECLVPADGFEDLCLAAGGHFPFRRAGPAPHRMQKPRRRINPVQILGHLGTQKAARHRMRRVALDPRSLTGLVDGYQNGARVRAIVRTNGLDSSRWGHSSL